MQIMARRGLAAFACVVIAGLAAAGCGASSSSGGSAKSGGTSASAAYLADIPRPGNAVNTSKWRKSGPWTIGYADASQSNSWRVFAWGYMRYGGSILPNTTIIHTNANNSTSQQVSDIENLMQRGVNCLIVGALSTTALDPVIEQAAKHIPVVISEGAVNTNAYTSFASLDEVNMGELQAQGVANLLHGKGNVVILQGVAGSGPVQQDLQGMKTVLKKYPGIKVLTTQYTSWSRDTGKTDMQNDLQAFPKIDAVLSDSGLQNDGAFEAVKAAGRLKQIKAWSGDTDQTWMRIVHQYKLPGIIVNRPTQVAEHAIQLCGAILSGRPVPKVWPTKNQVIVDNQVAKYIAPNTPGSDQWWDWWNLPAKWRPGQQS